MNEPRLTNKALIALAEMCGIEQPMGKMTKVWPPATDKDYDNAINWVARTIKYREYLKKDR